jgi:DNA-binding transcriptional ArsR family regulator
MQLFSKFVAGFLIVFGVIMLAGAIININEGRSSTKLSTDLMLIPIFALLPMFGGAYWLYSIHTKNRKEQIAVEQRMILSLAARLGGKISILDIAQHTPIPQAQAQKHLSELQKIGAVDLRVTESGEILYEIKGLLISDEERDSASRL